MERRGLAKVSGSNREEAEKLSGLPLVRVLFPAPFAPAMSVKTGWLTVSGRGVRPDAVRLPTAPAEAQAAGDPEQLSLLLLGPVSARIPARRDSWVKFTPLDAVNSSENTGGCAAVPTVGSHKLRHKALQRIAGYTAN